MFRRLNIISQVLRQQNIAYASTVAPKKKLIPLITCKRTEFNLMLDEHDRESDGSRAISEIKLASQNWQHYKAKGDHFIIHPVRDVVESNLKNSTDIHWFELDEELTKNAIEKHDVEKMTMLQNEAINDIKLGKHVLIAAETGCGKVIDLSCWQSHQLNRFFVDSRVLAADHRPNHQKKGSWTHRATVQHTAGADTDT